MVEILAWRLSALMGLASRWIFMSTSFSAASIYCLNSALSASGCISVISSPYAFSSAGTSCTLWSFPPHPAHKIPAPNKIPNIYFFTFYTLSGPALLFLHQGRERIVRLCLIPVCHTCHIVLALKQSPVAHTYLLYGHPQILLKADGVLNMPSVEASHRRAVIIVVKIMDCRIMGGIVGVSQIRGAVILLHRPAVHLLCKAIGASEIVFCPGAADGGIVFISIQIELDLPFSPPVTFQCGQRHIRPHIVTFSLHLIQDHVILLQPGHPLPPPPGMEIRNILRQRIIETVIHLVEKGGDGVCVLVLQGDPGLPAKRHLEIAVHPPAWHHCHGNGIDDTFPSEPAAEEISERTFHRRLRLIIPVHAQHQVPEHKTVRVRRLIRHCDPDMIDHSRPFYLSQCDRLPAADMVQTRAAFSGCSQIACRHTALSLFPCGVLRINGPAPSVLCSCQCSQTSTQIIVHIFSSLFLLGSVKTTFFFIVKVTFYLDFSEVCK